MKLLLLSLLLTILVNSITSTQFVSIIPYGTFQCGSEPVGQGYYLPLQKCINIYSQDTYFEIIDDQLVVSFSKNCSSATPVTMEYDLDTCSVFKLLNTRNNYASFISLVASPPKNAISNNFYFNSNTCSGDHFQIFHTNGLTQDFYKYACDNGVPSIYDCNPITNPSGCQVINTPGCKAPSNYIKYPNDVTCQP